MRNSPDQAKVKSIQPLCKNKACQDLGYVTRGKEKRRRPAIKVVAMPSGTQVVDQSLSCESCYFVNDCLCPPVLARPENERRRRKFWGFQLVKPFENTIMDFKIVKNFASGGKSNKNPQKK